MLRPVTWHCNWCKLAYLDKLDSNRIQPWEVGMLLCGESERFWKNLKLKNIPYVNSDAQSNAKFPLRFFLYALGEF